MAVARDQRPWLDASILRGMAAAGWTYQDIADENYRRLGWRPHRTNVGRYLAELGVRRRRSRKDLIPWTIRPEHAHSRLRRMLEAESKRRAGEQLNKTEEKLISMLNDLLFGRGVSLIIGYDDVVGFYLADRIDSDVDIIRVIDPSRYNGHRQNGRVPSTPKS